MANIDVLNHLLEEALPGEEDDDDSNISDEEDDEDDGEDSNAGDDDGDGSIAGGTDDGASIANLQLEDPSTAESKIQRYLEDARAKIRRNPTLHRPAAIQPKPVAHSAGLGQIPGSTAQYDAYGCRSRRSPILWIVHINRPAITGGRIRSRKISTRIKLPRTAKQRQLHQQAQSSAYQTPEAYQAPQPCQKPPQQTYPLQPHYPPPASAPTAQPPYAAYPPPSQYPPPQQSQFNVPSGSKPPPTPPRPSAAQNQSSYALDFKRLQQKAQKFTGRLWK
ncbi:MAG: hypothetical protein Q9164_004151 [Protoblastenia rupestris]